MSDVKTLEVLDAAQLGEGQMKAVEFDGGKVLLSKINGEVVRILGRKLLYTAARWDAAPAQADPRSMPPRPIALM